MATVKVKCPYCGSEEVSLYGKSSTGAQRYLYRNEACKRKTFQLEYKDNASKLGVKEKIVEMAMNGAGTRDTGRVLGVSKDTATAVLKNEKVHSVSQRKVSFGAKRNGKDRYCGMQCIGSEM